MLTEAIGVQGVLIVSPGHKYAATPDSPSGGSRLILLAVSGGVWAPLTASYSATEYDFLGLI